MRRKVRHVLAKQMQVPRGRTLKSGEDVKQRRLAGPVRSNDANEFVVPHVETDISKRLDPAVRLADALGVEKQAMFAEAIMAGGQGVR